MTAGARHLLGLAMASVSFLGSIIICALPQWRVTKAQNSRSDDFDVLSEGLWKACLSSSTYGSMTQCRIYGSKHRPIPEDLEVARALIIIAIITGVMGILLGVAGSKFINFVPDKTKKSKMAMASGVVFLIAGLFVLIPISWTTNTISVPLQGSLKMELGASVYIGWITTVLQFLGGGFLCSSFLCTDGTD